MASAAPEIPVLARNQAFETLYRRYVTDVYHYALALLRNPADAEDVTQTTFLNAYRAYQSGIEVAKPQNWPTSEPRYCTRRLWLQPWIVTFRCVS